ncbi:MAG TPA: ribonuclease D [Gemmatimonadaceae bacterium]|nr:ribonuclease D [Gemmatimonadaceae bacterium]
MNAARAGRHPTARYIEAPDDAERLLASIRGEPIIAVDTEGASFHRFVDRIYLLQLSTRALNAVLDPLAIGTPPSLGVLLQDPSVETVFHDADYDLRLLHQDYGWHVRNIFDTRVAAQLLGIRAFGLAALLERYFGVQLDKKWQRADWSTRPLPPAMLEYAAQDTRYLLQLRDRMRDDLERAGRLPWAEEEFRRMEGTQWNGDASAGDAFLRLKGARDLSRRELAILRELVAWRDRVAAEVDRATFRVMSNEALFAIAREAPRELSALEQIKGVPRGLAARRGDEMLNAVRLGLAVPESELPRFPRAPRWERDPDFDQRVARLRAVRDTAAHRLDLDPGVLCSRDRLEAIARRRPRTVEELAGVEDLRRWQVEQLGEELLRAVKG